MTYTKEAAAKIYQEVFGIKPERGMAGQSALGSYKNMMLNIKLNYTDVEKMANLLNSLIMPYYDDIKANPGKVL